MKVHRHRAVIAGGQAVIAFCQGGKRLGGLLLGLLAAGSGMAGQDCQSALERVDPAPFLTPGAPCVAERQALCLRLQGLKATEFDALAASLRGEAPAPGQVGAMTLQAALAACGLDYAELQARQCSRAYSRENLDFVLKYCREEAWSLARAQCERAEDTVSPRYADFCYRFHHGMAP